MEHPRVTSLRQTCAEWGLTLTHFNSGSRRNSSNGFRFFVADGSPPDHFGLGCIFQAGNIVAAEAFLAGWRQRALQPSLATRP